MSKKAGEDENFRRRRLSLAEPDLSQVSLTSPSAGDAPKRARRLSMSPEMGVVKPREQLPFPPEVVGTYSCHGVEPGARAGQTAAKINQDRGCVCYPFGPKGDMALFCVYDGHGANGDKVSHFVMNEVQTTVEDLLGKGQSPKQALTTAFEEADSSLAKNKAIDAELSGTTAVVVLYHFESPTSHKMWAACAGDSRAVFSSNGGKKVTDATVDQKPDTPAEQRRIEQAGGYVSPPEEEWGGPARVWLDRAMTLPGLAMGRSIGDHLVKTVGVIATPEVTEFTVDPKSDEILVLCSDGVWEFIDSEQAIQILMKEGARVKKDATAMCTKLIETAAAKWRQEEGDYRDDITAICINIAPAGAAHFAQAGSR